MAVKSGTGDKPGVSIPIIVVAVLALLAFVGWIGYRTFGPEPPVHNELTDAHDKWLDKVARDSGGDINKVSQEDQMKLQKQYMGHGEQMLKSWLKDHPNK